MTSLLKRLEDYLEENPKRDDISCIERVKKLVIYETENPQDHKPYRLLKGLKDFIIYYHLHPKWKKYSSTDAKRDKKGGAGAFYSSFRCWARKQTEDKEIRKKLTQKIFIPKRTDISNLKTKKDWKKEFDRHYEWQGYSPIDAMNDRESGAAAFYALFHRFVRNQTKDKEERKQLIRYIFKLKQTDWFHLGTIKDWKTEYDKHPKWKKYSSIEKHNDKIFNSFYTSFLIWARKQTEDKKERKKLIQEIFKPKWRDWSYLNTLNDWKEEFNRHSEWEGYSTTNARKDNKTGASAFYASFGIWIRKQTKDKEERKRLMQEVFTPKTGIKLKTPSQLINILNTEPKARYAVENAVKLSDPKQIDITVADVLAVVWEGRIKRDNLIDMLQRPNLAGYLGKFVKNNGKKLPDFIEAAKSLLPYDKNNAIRDLIKRRIETWLYDESLKAIPSKKEISAVIQKIEEQSEALK